MKLKDLILEVNDPGPEFVDFNENYSLKFIRILKSNRISILKMLPKNIEKATPKEIISICHKLNSVFETHKNKFPCKIYFSDPDPKNWKARGYSKILKNPCFNVCHFADENTVFYEKGPHIVLEITKNLLEYLQSEDYMTLQLNVCRGLGHEIIHYLQHHKMKDYSTKIVDFYSEKSVQKRYSNAVDHPDLDDLIKKWTMGKRDNREFRKEFCKNYLCATIELSPQAFSCFSDILFYEKLKNPSILNDDLKTAVIQSIEKETIFKSRVMKIFVNVAQELQPKKFDQFKEFCLKYAENECFYDFVE